MTSRRRAPLLAALLLAATAVAQDAGAPQEPRTPQNPFHPFDQAKFELLAEKLGASPAQRETFALQIVELGVTRAADNLIRAAVPAFDAAVRMAENGDPAAALELTKVLAGTSDLLLQAHVRYHLARVFLDSDDPERAIEVLNDYLRLDINVSPLDAEAAFFYPQALAEIPAPELALPRFRAFLQWFPDASERFRSAAHQRILEIERQKESRLHQLADGMKKTTRDLRNKKTDKPVQTDQEKYLEELDELIEMYQEMEKQSSGPPSGNGPSQAPAGNSALPEGEGSVGKLEHRPSLADRWGNMRDVERKKIEADVQRGLPPQYRKMLEEYYKKLGRAPGNQ